MADVKGAVIGNGEAFSAEKFVGRRGSFLPGGSDAPELTRYQSLRGWNPATDQWETWVSRSTTGSDNPSRATLAHVTRVPWEKIAFFNED